MLGDIRLHITEGLALGKLGKLGASVLGILLFLQGGTEDTLDLTPSLVNDTPAFCREGMAAALENGGHGLVGIGFRRRTEQTAADEKEQITLTHRQSGDIRLSVCIVG